MKRLARQLLPPALYDSLAALWDRGRALHPERVRRAREFARLNRQASPDEMVLRPGLRLGVDPGARGSFEQFCFRSLDMVRELDAFLALRQRFTRLVDVGALHGIFALAFTAGRPEAEALAIEPSPLAWLVLGANLDLNAAARITPLQVALGSAPGQLAMRQDWHHLEALPADAAAAGATVVRVETLDRLCEERSLRPDAIKIDVEGFEHEVLRGASATLEHFRPWLFLEVHPARLVELGSSAQAVLDLVREHGYRAWRVDEQSPADPLFRRSARVFRVVAQPG